jgi:hypothetical protein
MATRKWQFIGHRLHGWLDVLVDLTLTVIAGAAWWHDASVTAVVLPGLIAAANLTYSSVTRYALGRRHLIGFSTHLALDAVAGIALVIGAAALTEPLPYRGALLAMGLGILGAVLLTDPEVAPDD